MDLKQMAAEKAAEFIQSNNIIGLGTGTTSDAVLNQISQLIKSNALCDIQGVPTSLKTEKLAKTLGIQLVEINSVSHVDITIDGADEFDSELNVLKGQGGALTREKIVASASKLYVIAVDASKRVEKLASRCPLPVEVLPFGWTQAAHKIEQLGSSVSLRELDGQPFVTDQGNYILECVFNGGLGDPKAVAVALKSIPGVVEHGLFLGMADKIVIASETGVEILKRGRT